MRPAFFLLALLPSFALASGTATAPAAPSPVAGMLPLVFVFVIFYFLLIRPQRKRMQEHEAMVKAAKKGDTVLTAGGIIGRITATQEDTVTVEIAQGVEVKVARSTLTNLLDKDGKPLAPAKPEKNDGKNDNVKAPKSVANDN